MKWINSSYWIPLSPEHISAFRWETDLCGVLVWGSERLHLTLDRIDLWDHRGGKVLSDAGHAIPILLPYQRNGWEIGFHRKEILETHFP